MNFLSFGQSIILGIVEGLTEFLPISSTFHLIFSSKILGISETELLTVFQVFIQSGAILAVLWLFWKDIFHNRKMLEKLILSFIPTAVVGFLLHSIIKNYFFETPLLMIGAFVSVGILFILFEKWHAKNTTEEKTLEELTWKDAVIIGLGQALAVLPGVSRAGAVILTMMFLKVRRDEAAKYSFLLALPTILSAAALDVLSFKNLSSVTSSDISLFAVGFISAFFSALIVLKWFISYLQSHTLVTFGWYRIIAGMILLLLV